MQRDIRVSVLWNVACGVITPLPHLPNNNNNKESNTGREQRSDLLPADSSPLSPAAVVTARL